MHWIRSSEFEPQFVSSQFDFSFFLLAPPSFLRAGALVGLGFWRRGALAAAAADEDDDEEAAAAAAAADEDEDEEAAAAAAAADEVEEEEEEEAAGADTGRTYWDSVLSALMASFRSTKIALNLFMLALCSTR